MGLTDEIARVNIKLDAIDDKLDANNVHQLEAMAKLDKRLELHEQADEHAIARVEAELALQVKRVRAGLVLLVFLAFGCGAAGSPVLATVLEHAGELLKAVL